MDIAREARRLLDRYLDEVVDRFGLCPWAGSARRNDELRIEIIVPSAQPGGVVEADATEAAVIAAVARIATDPRAALGMVVIAASSIDPPGLRRLRDRAMRPDVVIADFHPGSSGDLGTPARLVPLLRRSPDPMLQVVRWSVLESARRPTAPPDRRQQARLLAGHVAVAPPDVSDNIARTNHATISAAGMEALVAVLDELARDRAAAYAAYAARAGSRS